MLTLGFTNHYYTLWNVTSFMRYGRGETVNGVFNGESWLVINYNYIQNLSMDYDLAVEKITLLAGESSWSEDLTLKGEHGSFRRTVRQTNAIPQWQFTFGKLTYTDIRTATNAWQLNRAMNEEIGGRRRVYARRRLIELGELIRYDWVDKVFDAEASQKAWEECDGNLEVYSTFNFHKDVKRKYATLRQVARFEKEKAEREQSGHFFTHGARITLEIKKIESFSFEGQFGTTHICKYITCDGKLVKYMGSNPPDISLEEFVTVKATIKHSEYKGILETKLQRIKI